MKFFKYTDELDELESNRSKNNILTNYTNIVKYIGLSIYILFFIYNPWILLLVVLPLLLFIYLIYIIKYLR